MSRKTPVLFISLILFSTGALAQEQSGSGSNVQANILAGNVAVDGFVDLTRRSGAGSDATEYSAGVTSSYFVQDYLALGLRAAVSGASDSDTGALLGPSVMYFFWQEDKMASFARFSVQFGLTDITFPSLIQGELGLEHFIVPAVAVGPAISYTHYNSRFSDFQRLGFTVKLAIYL